MKRVVVLGAGGYIGIPLCHELVKRGYFVTAIDRYFFGKKPDGCSILQDDIRTDWDGVLHADDTVIDLAGLSNDATAEIDENLTTEINERGAINLAIQCRNQGVRRYIYSSSASVYGHGIKPNLTEKDDPAPLTAYARSKLAVEKVLCPMASESFEPVILRNATVFGVAPRMRFDLAVNVMTMRAWKEGVIYVMGGGGQCRPFVHIDDVVKVFCEMIEMPAAKVSGQIFNVGNDVMNYTISQIATMVRHHVPTAKIHFIPDDPDKRSYHVSFRKLRELGIECNRSIEQGIVEVIRALETGVVKCDDPTTNTLGWYKTMLEWDKRISELKIDGRLL